MAAPVGLTTWRSLLLVSDPRCSTLIGAALMPVANGNLAHPRINAEDDSCSASLASQLSCPARLSRSVAAHFSLQRNGSPRPAADKNVGAVSRGGRLETKKYKCKAAAAARFPIFCFRSAAAAEPSCDHLEPLPYDTTRLRTALFVRPTVPHVRPRQTSQPSSVANIATDDLLAATCRDQLSQPSACSGRAWCDASYAGNSKPTSFQISARGSFDARTKRISMRKTFFSVSALGPLALSLVQAH